LSRRNGKEYVLVYDHGPVYYYFHWEFVEKFRAVIREWSEGMRASGRYPEHEPTFNYGHDNDDDDEDGAEIEAEDIESEDENVQDQLKHEKSPRQGPNSRRSSSQPQPRPTASSPRSSQSNTSVPNAPGGVLQQGFEANESKEVSEGIPSTVPEPSMNVILPLSSRSMTSPERVHNQPVVPRADHGLEDLSVRPDSMPTHTSTPSSRPKRSRGTSKSEAIKAIRRGVKDLLS
jgi:hypothetical protein